MAHLILALRRLTLCSSRRTTKPILLQLCKQSRYTQSCWYFQPKIRNRSLSSTLPYSPRSSRSFAILHSVEWFWRKRTKIVCLLGTLGFMLRRRDELFLHCTYCIGHMLSIITYRPSTAKSWPIFLPRYVPFVLRDLGIPRSSRT